MRKGSLDLLGSKTKYDEVTAHEVLHQGIKSDVKLLPQIKNIMKSQGIDIEAEAEKYKQAYIEQFKRDWYKITPESEQVMMGEKNARDQAYLYAKDRYEAEAEEEVAARYFGTVAAELGLGNIVGDNTINRIAAKVGIDGKSRNLSRRILSAVAKYNRVQNAKSKKAQSDTKNKNASDTETENVSRKKNDTVEIENAYKLDGVKNTLSENFISSTFDSFSIEKMNDCVHVQRRVLDTLVKEGFFTNVERRSRVDINEETGMEIETNKSSIDETFDKNNYRMLGKKKKALKLATIRMLPEIITKGKVLSDNVKNYHGISDTSFAYIEHEVQVDGIPVIVKITVKKSKSKNKMWVHTVYTNENVSGLDVISENGHGTSYRTADNGSVTHFGENVNTKTSYSQTSEKKSDTKTPKMSKGKTADDVYEKGRKLKVGDKVGEVKLVADESGKPITPVLRASFDRTDVPSYILATVEATGDTALIAELEEETALMMMGDLTGERAQLTLHDAVEALSEHVRDGSITPEQAAHILSEENAHPTGADVDTLIGRENLSSVKYMVAGERSLTADSSMLDVAKYFWNMPRTNHQNITHQTGWWYDDVDGKWKYEISDSEMKYDPNGFIKQPHTLADFIKHDELFAAYPQLKDVEVRFADLNAQRKNGKYDPKSNLITINQTKSVEQQKKTLVHEIQHAVQEIENFATGSNEEIAYLDLFIKEYENLKDTTEFKKLSSADDKIDFIENSIDPDEKIREEMSISKYRNSHGEVESRVTANRRSLSKSDLKKKLRAYNSFPIIDKSEVYSKLVDILTELGYTESEINNSKRNTGVTNDEQRYADKLDTSVQSWDDRMGRRGVNSVGEIPFIRGREQTRRVSRRQEPLGRSDTGTEEAGVRQYVDGIKYSISLPDTETVAAIDREARVKNIVALANSLQDGVRNDAEYAALERVKGNAEIARMNINNLTKKEERVLGSLPPSESVEGYRSISRSK